MIEREDRLVEHQNGIIEAKIIGACIGNFFDGPNHVVAEVPNRAAREWRKVGQLDGLEMIHGGSKFCDEVRRLPIAVAHDEEWIDADEGIARDSFPTFNAFEQKGVRS